MKNLLVLPFIFFGFILIAGSKINATPPDVHPGRNQTILTTTHPLIRNNGSVVTTNTGGMVTNGSTAPKNYYVSNSGNDANSGTDASSPWRTLNKLNSFKSLAPGDKVLFKRGDTFYGNLTVSSSGSSVNPITYGAYGSGAQPIITGFTNVTSWKNMGSNIWESASQVSSLSYVNTVAINAINAPMGRYPNSDYLTFQSHNGTSSITSSSLTGSPNWTGADIVIRKQRFATERSTITRQEGGTVYQRNLHGQPSNGWGFFIENDLRTLDVQGEWYYNPSTKKISVYSTATPSTVQVASIDTLISMRTVHYITFDNLSIQGANNILLFNYSNSSDHITVTNCSLAFSGQDGIQFNGSYHNILNNTVTDCGENGIFMYYGNPGSCVVKYNTVKNVGMITGILENDYSGAAIRCTAAKTLIQYNDIDSTGHTGIIFRYDSVQVRNNFINNSALVRDDAAGISTGFPNEKGKVIDGNIILNSIGTSAGTNKPASYKLAHGIYIDDLGTYVSITNNTVANTSSSGIKIHNANNVVVRNNTVFDVSGDVNNSSQGCLEYMYDDLYPETGKIRNVSVYNNIFFQKTATQYAIYVSSSGNLAEAMSFGTSDSNYYMRPIDDNLTVRMAISGAGLTYKNLAEWKTISGQDAHTGKSSRAITDFNDLRFVYNATLSNKTIALDANYIDVKGLSYNGTITLSPYTSRLLTKNGSLDKNQTPVAKAGADQTITLPVNNVSLSGSGVDTDGTIVSYSWSKISGASSYKIENASSAATVVSGLSAGVYQFELKVTDNKGATAKSTVQVTVNEAANVIPVAKAGADQTITLPVNNVSLSGNGVDTDGKIVSYSWTKISGASSYKIESASSAATVVSGLEAGVYQFELKVTDNKGATAKSTVQVTVNEAANVLPVAKAGADQTITLPVSNVSLSGNGDDTDGKIVSYSWTKISGPSKGSIKVANAAVTTVTGLIAGVYQFELKVTDNKGATAKSTVQVTVNEAANILPVAKAGADQTITLPVNNVSLSGSGVDTDGKIVSYSWTEISGASSYKIESASSSATVVSGLTAGVYQFELKVTDNKGATAKSTVQVTVNEAANVPPVAKAGADQTITLPVNNVSLSGSGVDTDGKIVSYSWTKISGASSYKIENASSAATVVSGLSAGVYQFELKVTDNKGATSKSTLKVTVNEAVNVIPVAKAGADQMITLPVNNVSLSGNGIDTDGTIVSYSWTEISGASSYKIESASSSATVVSGLTAGVYQFELKVTDNKGATAKSTVQVTVNEAANVLPVAKAGAYQTITLPVNNVSLSGNGVDTDGKIVSYSWTKISGASSYKIESASSAATVVSGLTAGVYQFELKVTDNKGATAKSTVQVTVNEAANVLPVAEAGADQTITLPVNNVSLSGSGVDTDGTIVSYSWSKISGPSKGSIKVANAAVTTVTGLTAGVYQFELKVTDNKGATSKSTVQVTVNEAANVLPVAKAGADQTITLPVNNVSLSGSGVDTDGTIVSYSWTKISGASSYKIESASSSATVVSGLTAGVYQFELKVTDNKGATAKSTVQVTVNEAANVLPVAKAGADQTITLPVNNVSLSGNGIDTDGKIVSYSWTKISGASSYKIESASSAATVVSGLSAGVYQFELKVTDNKGATSKSTLKVTVNEAVNVIPVAKAGADQMITLPVNNVSLSGSGDDTDGKIVSYSWTKISGASSYKIENASSAATVVSGLSAGVYQFELKVTDNKGATAKSTVQVTVNEAANILPVAKAGADQTITLPVNNVSLSGSGDDTDGKIVSYSWTKISGPSKGSIKVANAAVTTVTGLIAGVYQFELKVTDNKGATAKSTVQVTVNEAANVLPVAKAGADQTITLPVNNVSLSGNGVDTDGKIVSYSWTKISGASSYKIESASSAATVVSGLEAGVYQFELKVTDNKGATSKSTVQVTVNEAANVLPVAKAGADQTITLPVNNVSLSGNGVDTDGKIVSYSWTKISGASSYKIENASSSVTVVSGLEAGVYQFELKVTDNKGATAKSTVQVTVNEAANVLPVAKAGADQTITLPVNNVSLSGSGVDTDGTIVSYSWTKISGASSYKIENASSAATVVSGLEAGVYQFELKVTDNKGATAKSTVQVTVNEAANVLPVAIAGKNRDITLPDHITSLAGNGSDEDGIISSYSWTKISGPSSYNIVNASSPVTDVSNLVEGVYQFELKVTDNKGGVGKDTMQITVNEKKQLANTNIAPMANSGNDTTVVSRINAVTLNGSGIDADGKIVSYKWNQISGPSNSTILSNNMATAYVNDLLEGTSQFELTVTDDLGAEGKDTVSVTVALGRTASERNSIKVYPNPVHDIANVEISTEKINTKLSVVITDIKGRSVYKEEFVSTLNNVKEKINMNHLAKGTYIITVLFDGMKKESFKVIKL